MALFNDGDFGTPERGTNSKLIVGDKGDPIAQGERQEQITRAGAGAAQADFDILDDGGRWDLISEDFNIPSDTALDSAPNIGGTSELSGGVDSKDSNEFQLVLEWTDGNGNVSLEEKFDSSGGRLILESVTVKSDVLKAYVTDISGAGQNRVRGTLNFH
jgi:hypothetical protein